MSKRMVRIQTFTDGELTETLFADECLESIKTDGSETLTLMLDGVRVLFMEYVSESGEEAYV